MPSAQSHKVVALKKKKKKLKFEEHGEQRKQEMDSMEIPCDYFALFTSLGLEEDFF